jgi:hypothetical protein
MSQVSRAAKGMQNKNKLRAHKVKIYFQRFPGKIGTDAERAVTDTPAYKIIIDGVAAQWGKLEADGSVECYIPVGSKVLLESLGTTYELKPLAGIEAHNTLEGCQRRLSLLGYYDAAVNNKYGERTDAATLDFQADNGLDPDGKLNVATTYDKLKSVFGE